MNSINQFLLMTTTKGQKRRGLARVVRPGRLAHLSSQYEKVWNVQARNKEQRLALELLMDPDVQLVTLGVLLSQLCMPAPEPAVLPLNAQLVTVGLLM